MGMSSTLNWLTQPKTDGEESEMSDKKDNIYPKSFRIETADGDGEAIKTAQGMAWDISYPTGGFRWHGSQAKVQQEIRRRLRADYPELHDVVKFPRNQKK